MSKRKKNNWLLLSKRKKKRLKIRERNYWKKGPITIHWASMSPGVWDGDILNDDSLWKLEQEWWEKYHKYRRAHGKEYSTKKRRRKLT